MGRVREEKRREEKKKEDQRRERLRRKKMQVRKKVEEGRETRSFSNVLGLRHAVVARSTSRCQNAQNTSCSKDFWELRLKKCTQL